jgi:hypothetical protein
MKQITFLLVAVAALAGVVAITAPAPLHADEAPVPIFVTTIPPGYRDWRLISVAHEEGMLHSFAAVLGNDVAIKAYRVGKLPFPYAAVAAAGGHRLRQRRRAELPRRQGRLRRPKASREPGHGRRAPAVSASATTTNSKGPAQLYLGSLKDASHAASSSTGAMKSASTSSGGRVNEGAPGSKARSAPLIARKTGYGAPARRASAARITAASTSARSTSSSLIRSFYSDRREAMSMENRYFTSDRTSLS